MRKKRATVTTGMTTNFKNKRIVLIIAAALVIIASAAVIFLKAKRADGTFIPQRDGYIRESFLIENADGMNEIKTNPYSDLSVPTYITKLSDLYFIVDCYHNEVIYNDNLDDPLYEWSVMTDDISMGHTVAGDGRVYLIDDTENNRVLIMEKAFTESGEPYFIPTQEFADIGVRPHYIIYNSKRNAFYVWSSLSGEMYIFKRESDTSRVYLTDIKSLPELYGVYVRSFTIDGDDIYFVSGNSSIIRASLDDFSIKEEYPVPESMAGMIQLSVIDGEFFITVSTDINGNQDYATFIKTDDLNKLTDGEYEDVYDSFIGGGTPYYITKVEDKYYLTEHRLPGHSIWSFEVINGEIENVEAIY